MEALTCPKCSAPLQMGMTACPYCGVGLVGVPAAPGGFSATPGAGSQPGNPASAAPAPVPPGWVLFQDPWNGFTLAHPPGWEVTTIQGQTTIRADPVGYTSAVLSPFTWPTPITARQLAMQFTSLASRSLQNFQAWQQGNVSPDSNRISIRMKGVRFGQMLEGIFNIQVEGSSCMVSGYQTLPQYLAQAGPVMAQILATFRTAERLPRQVVYEPGEGAFSVQIPAGWGWQAGVNRNNIGGAGLTHFSAGRDPQGFAMAGMPNYMWVFMEPVASFFSFPTGYPTLSYVTASNFVPKVLFKQMQKMHPDVKVLSAVERPDYAEYSQLDLMRSGYPPGMFDVSVAIVDSVYTENGQRLREKSRVNTMRSKGQTMWNANLDVTYRAPESEFAALEPVLTGILFSLQMNPQWQAGERGLAQNYINNSQADIHRRQMEISRTLSETSDIISNSYWNRQATYDRISEQRSNAMLGVQNVATPSGDVYKVPNGFDRYWADGLGNLYGGSWLTQPDINWQPLEPTGI